MAEAGFSCGKKPAGNPDTVCRNMEEIRMTEENRTGKRGGWKRKGDTAFRTVNGKEEQRHWYKAIEKKEKVYRIGLGDYVTASSTETRNRVEVKVNDRKHPFFGKTMREKVAIKGVDYVVVGIIKNGTKEYLEKIRREGKR
ncbi:MAG: hypothetical protein LIV11_06420 [Bacillota bacterium]|nr:hypothetical protein [Bacillota bacterium]